MRVVRSGLAAAAAILLMAMLMHLAAPALADHLPGKDAVSAVLGLAAVLLPYLYKLLDGAAAAIGLGRRSAPANSSWVSVLAGAATLALIGGAFTFVVSVGLQQSLVVAKGAPAAEDVLRKGLESLGWIRPAVLLFTALMVGSWTGRRHGLVALVVVGFSALGWLMILAIEVLSRLRDMAAVHEAFRTLGADPSLETLQATGLPLFVGIFALGFAGASLGGGNRRRNSVRDFKPLDLGGA